METCAAMATIAFEVLESSLDHKDVIVAEPHVHMLLLCAGAAAAACPASRGHAPLLDTLQVSEDGSKGQRHESKIKEGT